ncbi:MAG: RidA family protein [Bacteroidota bacterium]
MSTRINISSGSPWEPVVGFSRAVKIGSQVFVAGTVAVDAEGTIHGIGDYYEQAKYIFLKIEKALKEAGATLNDVVRTRMFVVDIKNWEVVAKAHAEFFKDVRPAATMVEISKLIDDRCLVEIEIDAIINN